MKLWLRAAGALKDHNSIWKANLSRRSSYHNPHLTRAIIKATSHDEHFLDYKNAQRVFDWIATSSLHFEPLFIGLTKRMQRTKCWVVALKGLILLHGVFSCKAPAAQRIGRLPFDFAKFNDQRSGIWVINVFIRQYYTFLDQKSVYLSMEAKEFFRKGFVNEVTLTEEISRLQRLQKLLDLMLQIRPLDDATGTILVLEAMDCIIIELYDIYSKICGGIAGVLMRIYDAERIEATMALDVLHKAREQSQRLPRYFNLCKKIGVINASSVPKVEQIPDEDIEEIQRFIYEAPVTRPEQDEKAIVAVKTESSEILEYKEQNGSLRTLITDKWEIFDEDSKVIDESNASYKKQKDVSDLLLLDMKPYVPSHNHDDLPDLITF